MAVAPDCRTREGEVWHRLLLKIQTQRARLGGAVFDVLGQVFRDQPLKELLIRAIRYGEQPEVKAKLEQIVDRELDVEKLRAYCVLRKPKAPAAGAADFAKLQAQFDRDSRLLPHRIADLGRFNIDVALIDEYREIEELLRKLCLAAAARNVFVSGSAHDYAPAGREKVERFCRKLGEQIIRRGYNLVSGFGLGIAGACIIGAHEQAKRERAGRIGERLRLHPFPQEFRDDAERRRVWTEIRTELIRESGVTIFVAGNKLDAASGRVVVADGVLEEFALARANSHVLIPVPATGGAAAQVWGQMRPNLADFFGRADIAPEFAVLEDVARPENDWIEAIFAIVNKTRTR